MSYKKKHKHTYTLKHRLIKKLQTMFNIQAYSLKLIYIELSGNAIFKQNFSVEEQKKFRNILNQLAFGDEFSTRLANEIIRTLDEKQK